ncbi:MAG: hypothetical protein AAGF12_07960 [Myxococcota bacterium]
MSSSLNKELTLLQRSIREEWLAEATHRIDAAMAQERVERGSRHLSATQGFSDEAAERVRALLSDVHHHQRLAWLAANRLRRLEGRWKAVLTSLADAYRGNAT